MKQKIVFVLISGVILMSTANAQISYGIRAGVNFAKWQGDDLQVIQNIVDKTNGYITTKGVTRFHVGGYVDIPIAHGISIEPGLEYSKKGYAMKGDLQVDALKFLGLNVGLQVQSHYIDMPLVVKVNLVKGLNVYAGPQFSYLLRSTLNAKAGVLGISLFNKGYGITSRFNRVDMGLTGGVGYQLANGFNIRAGYDYGLSKLDKHNSYSAYNRVIKVSVGFSF
jgi:hypothetical protein